MVSVRDILGYTVLRTYTNYLHYWFLFKFVNCLFKFVPIYSYRLVMFQEQKPFHSVGCCLLIEKTLFDLFRICIKSSNFTRISRYKLVINDYSAGYVSPTNGERPIITFKLQFYSTLN